MLQDLDLVRFIISCLTTYFPGVLAYLLLFEMPWLLSCTSQSLCLSVCAEQFDSTKTTELVVLSLCITQLCFN